MKKLILVFVFILIRTIVFGQNCFWAKNAGGSSNEGGRAIATDTSSNIYVTGDFESSSITIGTTTLTNSLGSSAFFIAKYSPSGSVLWAQGANGIATGNGIATDLEGNVYAIGHFSSSITFGTTTLNSSGQGDAFVVKYDTYGNLKWAKKIGGSLYDVGKSIGVSKEGNVYITGQFSSSFIVFGNDTIHNNGANDSDIFIAKLNANGEPAWAISAGGNRSDYGNSIAINNNDIFITGSFTSDSISFNNTTLYNNAPISDYFYIAKIDTSGNFIWANSAEPIWGNATGLGIVCDSVNNVLVTGTFSGVSITFGSEVLTHNSSGGNDDIFIVKYNANGDVIWANDAGGTDADQSKGIAIDNNCNIYLTGWFNSSSITFGTTTLLNNNLGSADIFIVKCDSSGNTLWAKKAGGTGTDISNAIAKGKKDNVYVTGTFFSNPAIFGDVTLSPINNYDIFVADLYNFNSSIASLTDATCFGFNNGIATTTASEGNLPYAYLWNTNPPQTTSSVTNLSAGNYTVTISEAFGCAQTHSVSIDQPPADTAKICMVSVDSLSMYNIIVWDKSLYTRVDSFIIYREISSNNYQPIARLPYSAPGEFIDTVRTKYFPNTGNPNNGTYRYKIQCNDTCGGYTELSGYHNTIYFLNNGGNFYWTQVYSIENQANPVLNYVLMRDDSSSGEWHDIASVSGTQQVVNDPLYIIYQDYASWRVRTEWSINCSIQSKESSSEYGSSLSNIYSKNIGIGLNEIHSDNTVKIYPNPATDKVNIYFNNSSNQNIDAKILDATGKVLIDKFAVNADGSLKFDISNLDSGIYFLKIIVGEKLYAKKLIKE